MFLSSWRLTFGRLNELDAMLEGGSPIGKWGKSFRRLAIIQGSKGIPIDYAKSGLSLSFLHERSQVSINPAKCLITFFNGSIVIASRSETESLSLIRDEIAILMEEPDLCIGECLLSNEVDVKRAYAEISKALPAACKVFRKEHSFEPAQIAFIRYVVLLKNNLGDDINAALQILQPLMRDERWDKYLETLTTLYIDCNGSLSETAKLLNIHLNTLKYRLKTISQLLGHNLRSTFSSSSIIFALAMYHIIN